MLIHLGAKFIMLKLLSFLVKTMRFENMIVLHFDSRNEIAKYTVLPSAQKKEKYCNNKSL